MWDGRCGTVPCSHREGRLRPSGHDDRRRPPIVRPRPGNPARSVCRSYARRMNRISVAMPEDLEAHVRELAGGNLSAYVLEAVRARVDKDLRMRAYYASIGGRPQLDESEEDRAAMARIRSFLQL